MTNALCNPKRKNIVEQWQKGKLRTKRCVGRSNSMCQNREIFSLFSLHQNNNRDTLFHTEKCQQRWLNLEKKKRKKHSNYCIVGNKFLYQPDIGLFATV